jgi:hypothetical protein
MFHLVASNYARHFSDCRVVAYINEVLMDASAFCHATDQPYIRSLGCKIPPKGDEDVFRIIIWRGILNILSMTS